MKILFVFSLLLNLIVLGATAQESLTLAPESPSPTSNPSPADMANSVSAFYSTLATSLPTQPGPGPSAGDVGSTAGKGDTDEGASGHDSGSIQLSQNGMIAIIVVIVLVCLFGIGSSVLWYLAKKRSWEVRKKIRSSARRVATALTPRRTTFPKDVHSQRKSTRGLTKLDASSDSHRTRSVDIEKANPVPKIKPFEMVDPPNKSKWTQKWGR